MTRKFNDRSRIRVGPQSSRADRPERLIAAKTVGCSHLGGKGPIAALPEEGYSEGMNLVLLVLVLLLVFGGGGFYFGGPAIGGGGVGLILLVCLVIFFMGGWRTKN